MSINVEQLQAIIQAAIANALIKKAGEDQSERRKTLDDLARQVAEVRVSPAQIDTPQIKEYEPIDITSNVACYEPLDAVKYLPNFVEAQETYVPWRQATPAA